MIIIGVLAGNKIEQLQNEIQIQHNSYWDKQIGINPAIFFCVFFYLLDPPQSKVEIQIVLKVGKALEGTADLAVIIRNTGLIIFIGMMPILFQYVFVPGLKEEITNFTKYLGSVCLTKYPESAEKKMR